MNAEQPVDATPEVLCVAPLVEEMTQLVEEESALPMEEESTPPMEEASTSPMEEASAPAPSMLDIEPAAPASVESDKEAAPLPEEEKKKKKKAKAAHAIALKEEAWRLRCVAEASSSEEEDEKTQSSADEGEEEEETPAVQKLSPYSLTCAFCEVGDGAVMCVAHTNTQCESCVLELGTACAMCEAEKRGRRQKWVDSDTRALLLMHRQDTLKQNGPIVFRRRVSAMPDEATKQRYFTQTVNRQLSIANKTSPPSSKRKFSALPRNTKKHRSEHYNQAESQSDYDSDRDAGSDSEWGAPPTLFEQESTLMKLERLLALKTNACTQKLLIVREAIAANATRSSAVAAGASASAEATVDNKADEPLVYTSSGSDSSSDSSSEQSDSD
jgi:hypothetical protein